MICAPVCLPLPPDMPFGALATAVLPGVYGEHPDFAQIDWAAVQWFKSGRPWTSDPAKSLADNGLVHKDVIRFRTPGLTGIRGSCS
jgi:phenol hydroxylase P4 protein